MPTAPGEPQLRRAEVITPETGALLVQAMFPDPERVRHTLSAYRTDPRREVYALEHAGRVVCAAGVQVSEKQAELLHIGTAPGLGGRHYATALINALMRQLGLERLEVQTDEHAVGFYRKAGFQVQEIETRWGRRYLCWLIQSTIHRAT